MNCKHIYEDYYFIHIYEDWFGVDERVFEPDWQEKVKVGNYYKTSYFCCIFYQIYVALVTSFTNIRKILLTPNGLILCKQANNNMHNY